MKRERKEITNPDIIVGLDIGTTKIATIVGYKNEEGRIEVLGYGKAESTGVQHGLIFNINKTVHGVEQSVTMAHDRSGQQIDEVYAGIAGRHIKNKEYKHEIQRINGKDTVIEQEEIDQMVHDVENILLPVGEKIITVIPQRFIIDGERETNEPVGEMGELIVGYFQVITGNENEIKKIVKCVNDAQLNVTDIILEPIASGLSCLRDEEKKQGVVLIDIGGGTTDVAIFYNGNPIYSEVIPFGGNVITKDIAHVCRITEELAESLKKKYGTCIEERSDKNNTITIPSFHETKPSQISEPYLAKIINARVVESIVNPVKKVIADSNYASNINAGIVLTGGGAMLNHLKELFQYSLVMPARIGKPDIGFNKSMPSELNNPMYATALGLLKYGIMENKSTQPKSSPVVTVKPEKYEGNPENGIFKKIQSFFYKMLETTE